MKVFVGTPSVVVKKVDGFATLIEVTSFVESTVMAVSVYDNDDAWSTD